MNIIRRLLKVLESEGVKNLVIGLAVASVLVAGLVVVQQFVLYDRTWRGLVVAPEHQCSPYNRKDYSYYPQSLKRLIQEEMGRAASGGWYGMYEARIFPDGSGSETVIEHIVALSEAHDSGMCARSKEERKAFASDLNNLTLATAQLNGQNQKGAKDAAEWLPENARCWFARTVVHVRQNWRLTVDEAERDELERLLSTCERGEVPERTPATGHPPVQAYENCALMREAGWTLGVARAGGTYQDAWDDAEQRTYVLNTTRDGDRDGHACE